jgi:nucleotide-binding universal stress UspA family protein
MTEQIPKQIRFILPVDYSEASRQAAVYALKLAKRLNAVLDLLHVYYSPSLDLIDVTGNNYGQNPIEPELAGNLEESELKTMDSFVHEITSLVPSNIPLLKTLLAGIPEDEIAGYIRENKPDLVIMGTRGKNVQKVAIFGSVTVSVMENITVPLLVIPEHYKHSTAGEANKIMYVTTFDNADFNTIDRLMNLIAPFEDIRLDCVHLESTPGNTWDIIKLEGLVEYIKKKFGTKDIRYTSLHDKNMLPELDAYIMDNNINVIAMTAQRKNLISKLFSPDISRKLLFHSTIPLLIFHS